jgi:ferredoxin
MKFEAFYFSATGNTERALGIVERELSGAGHSLEKTVVTAKTRAPDPADRDFVLVAFPVYAMAPPVMIARFLKKMPSGIRPDGGKTKAAVMAVDGGGGGCAGWRAADILRRRGYDVVSAEKFHYPANWSQVNGVFDEKTSERVTVAGDAAAAAWGASLGKGMDAGKARKPLKSALDVLMPPAYGLIGRRFLGKMYYADRDCDGCGLCARTCPAATISLKPGKGAKPYWRSNCESCNRCINVCPKGAIVSSIARIAFLLAAIVASSWALIWAYRSFAYRFIAASVAPLPAAVIDVLIIAVLIAGSHLVAIGPFDALVLRWLQRFPGLRRLFGFSFTKGKPRYLARGFKPSAGE